MLNFYRLETERVIIRCYEPQDAAAMSETILRNHAHLYPWLPWAVKDQHTVAFCLDLIRKFRGQYDLGIDFMMGTFDARDGRYIGGTGLHPRVGAGAYEIGYWMDQQFTGQGFATHVAAALTKAAFEYVGVHRMNIHMQVANTASKRIPEGLGYKCEGLMRQIVQTADGQFGDIFSYSMLREEFDASEFKAMELRAFGFDGAALEARL